MRLARTWMPARVGAWLRARRFGPYLASRPGELPAGYCGAFQAALDGPGADPLVADARRELAKLDAADARAEADQVDLQRRQAFFGLVALGGAVISTNPLPRRRRGALRRLIAALF